MLMNIAVLVVDIFAAVMTLIMIVHIKSKYTAVGRKEMVLFFYSYMACVLLEILLASNIVPFSSAVYKVARDALLNFSMWRQSTLG